MTKQKERTEAFFPYVKYKMTAFAFQALFAKKSLSPTFATKETLKKFFFSAVQLQAISNNDEKVLKCLLNYWMPQGCFPSQATIASFTGLTDRTVRNALSKLKNLGWIAWTNTRLGRRQSVNRYIFTLSRQIIHAVLNGIEKFKQKTAEIRDLFRRKNVPPSASFIFNNRRTSMNSAVRSVAKKVLNEAQGLDEGLSDFQKLPKEEMLRKLRALS